MKGSRLIVLAALVFLVAALRLVPHLPNFVPVVALALFAGTTFQNRWAAIAVVFAAMLFSDVLIGFDVASPFVYGSLLLIVFGGALLRRAREVHDGASFFGAPLLGASFGSSVVFFIITNLGVFLMQDIYPKTGAGLMACYVAALPFFGNSMVADMLYSVLLFGTLAAIEYGVPAVREERRVLA